MDKNPFEEHVPKNLPGATDEKTEKEAELKKNILRTIISIAVVIFIIFAIVLMVKFLPSIFGSFGSTFSKKSTKPEQLVLTVTPNPVTYPNPVTITIDHQNKVASATGAYSFSYGCLTDFYFEVPHASSTPADILSCDKTIYTASSSPIILNPVLTKGTEASIPFVLTYTKLGASTTTTSISATTTISVHASGTQVIPTTPTQITPISTEQKTITVPTTTTTKTVYRPVNSSPDLSVKILSVSQAIPGQRVFARIQVANVGGGITGTWTLSANLPSTITPFYSTSAQMSLSSGQIATYTIAFTFNPQNGRQINVTVDPKNLIREPNETNNTAVMSI
jgi:hypothetical protein